MASGVLVFVSVAVFFVTLLVQYLRKGNVNGVKNSKLPPGYSSWSFIGDLLDLLNENSLPPTTPGDFMKQRIVRYGKIFTINLLGSPVIVGDAELNRFVFQNEMRLFGDAWPAAFKKLMGETSIGVQVGDAHKQLKTIIANFSNSGRDQTSLMHECVDQVAAQTFSSWEDGSVISVVATGKRFIFNIMAKCVLGLDLNEPRTEMLREDMAKLSAKYLFIPLNFPGTHYNGCLRSRTRILKLIDQLVDERTNTEGNAKPEQTEVDLLTWVMKNTSLSRQQIGDLLLGVIFAGSDTSATFIPLSIYFLGTCPKAIEQLREEYNQVVRLKMQSGETKVTWDDYKKMEFTQCVINETLRLGNNAVFLMKKAYTDIEFKDYVIPAGCKVIIPMAAAHLDPSLFENPEHFDPWRWESSSGLKKANNFMAFGWGARMCPGAELGRFEIAVFMHHLMSKYSWKLAEDDLQPRYFPIKFPKGLPIKVHPRSLEEIGDHNAKRSR